MSQELMSLKGLGLWPQQLVMQQQLVKLYNIT